MQTKHLCTYDNGDGGGGNDDDDDGDNGDDDGDDDLKESCEVTCAFKTITHNAEGLVTGCSSVPAAIVQTCQVACAQ